jgi:hypothetical protein
MFKNVSQLLMKARLEVRFDGETEKCNMEFILNNIPLK